MKAAAYVHGPERVHRLGRAFAEGCKRHGIPCEVLPVSDKPINVDLVWLYGLGPAKSVFDAYEGKAKRLVGDKGYFAEYADRHRKFFRYSVDSQQPTQAMVKDRPGDRWKAFGLNVEPVKTLGDYTLVCGMGPKQCARLGLEYGQWEREQCKHGALVREKPKNPRIPGLKRCNARSASEAIRGARLVICKTGNIGADCILHGVPVKADAGPGALEFKSRDHALANIAYWQWTVDEIAAGELLANL